MATVADCARRSSPSANGRVDMRVQVRGSGPPLVFLHPAAACMWDPFLEELAPQRTVYAPLVPGTSAEDPDAIDEVRDLWELVLLEQEALAALGAARRRPRRQLLRRHARLRAAGDVPRDVRQARRARPDRAVARRRARSPTGSWPRPQELPAMLFADPASPAPRRCSRSPRTMSDGGRDRRDDLGDGLHGEVRLAGPRPRSRPPAAPHHGADARRSGARRTRSCRPCTPRSSAAGSRARASRCSRAAGTSRRWRSRRRRSRSSGGS